MAAPPMPVVAACEANFPLRLTRVKCQARLVLVTMGKHPYVLDPASEPNLMDTELDLALFSKEGALVMYLMKRKHRHPMGSKNKHPKGTRLSKLALVANIVFLSLCQHLESFNCSWLWLGIGMGQGRPPPV
ncbi:hypothetical protein M0R45_035815 [Rubus argutus]|uniref:Uncharacterized protein n=1 Tax=Rubus argutus TaxID=59490 RepID=A0AAW1VZH7_RUBAR